MRISLLVSKPRGEGTRQFFSAFKELMKDAHTWKVEAANLKGATIASTATITSLPCKPRWKLTEHSVGSIEVECLNGELEPAQVAHALGDLVYLCLTALGRHVAKIEIIP